MEEDKMKFNKSITLVLLILIITISPALASTDQNADGIIIGDNNKQSVSNDYTNNEVDQSSNSYIDGNHNIMTQVNVNNQDTNTDNRVSTDSSTTNVFMPSKSTPNYYGLDAGVVNSYIMSLYEGQVLVAMNDEDETIISKPGDTYRYGIRSSVPVLAYVINANDAKKAEWDSICAPKYDIYSHKFELGNIDEIYVGKYRSPNQEFDVIIPEDKPGRYALVIDTRVAHTLDGQTTKITDDSVDIMYYMQKIQNGTLSQFKRDKIGKIDMFPISMNGMADTGSA
jgi:hypothetical protein